MVIRGAPGTSATALVQVDLQDLQETSDDDDSSPNIRILRSHHQE